MIHNEDTTDLVSYSTTVATYNHKTGEMIVNGWYSQTTARHINSFLEKYGFDRASKEELDNWIK
jgi:hypothetical protein